jgi:hypothetical protein
MRRGPKSWQRKHRNRWPCERNQCCRASPDSSAVEKVHKITPNGLTSHEVAVRPEKGSPNAMPDNSAHPLRKALAKLLMPAPRLPEASIDRQVHRHTEAFGFNRRSGRQGEQK